jgi:hypothetical protein
MSVPEGVVYLGKKSGSGSSKRKPDSERNNPELRGPVLNKEGFSLKWN